MRLTMVPANKRVRSDDKDFIKNATNEISELAEQANTIQQLIYMANITLVNGVRYESIKDAMDLIDKAASDIAIQLNQLADEMNVHIQNLPVM